MKDSIARLLSQIERSDEDQIVGQIERLIKDTGNRPLKVKSTRDTFSKMLSLARGGQMQLIGDKTDDMVVMMSLQDLAAIVSSSQRKLSFGSALDEVDFKPFGRRIMIGRRNDGRAQFR